MKVKLNAAERLNLLNILPAQGDILTVRKVEELKQRMLFTDKEIEDLELKITTNKDGRVLYNWNEKGKEEIEFEIGEIAHNAIVKTLKEMNEKKQITANLIPLWDKFEVEEKEEEEEVK